MILAQLDVSAFGRKRADHHNHLTAFHFRHVFNLAEFFRVFGDTFQKLTTQILVRHFATAEPQGHFHLVTILKELDHVAHLDLVVMHIGARTEFYFLDFNGFLLFAGFGFPLLLFVFELAIIHDLTDGRIGIRRNLDEIKSGFSGHIHGSGGGYDPDIFTLCADQANFRCTDAFIDARSGVTGRRGIMRSAGYGKLLSVVAFVLPENRVNCAQFQPGFGDIPHKVIDGEIFAASAPYIPVERMSYAELAEGGTSCKGRMLWPKYLVRKTHMTKRILTGALMTSLALSLAACKEEDKAAEGEATSGSIIEQATEAATDAADSVTETVTDAADSVTEAAEDAADVASDAAEAATEAASDAVEAATDAVEAAGEGAVDAASDAAETAVDAATDAADAAAEATEAATDAASDAAEAATDMAGDATDAAADMAADAAETAADTAEAAADVAADAAGDAVEAAADTAETAVDAVTEEAMDAAPAFDLSTAAEVLTVDGFDLDKATEVVNASPLSETAKATIVTGMTQAKDNPEILSAILEKARTLLGM